MGLMHHLFYRCTTAPSAPVAFVVFVSLCVTRIPDGVCAGDIQLGTLVMAAVFHALRCGDMARSRLHHCCAQYTVLTPTVQCTALFFSYVYSARHVQCAVHLICHITENQVYSALLDGRNIVFLRKGYGGPVLMFH